MPVCETASIAISKTKDFLLQLGAHSVVVPAINLIDNDCTEQVKGTLWSTLPLTEQ